MLAALVLLATTVPAYAQTAPTTATGPTAATATNTKPKAKATPSDGERQRTNARKHLTASALIPFKIVAVGTAAAIGTPIAIAKCETRRMDTYSSAVRSELDAPDGSLPLVVASVPGQSLRAIGTIGEGVVNGLWNATESWDRPFSRKAFSLGCVHPID